MTDEMKKEMMLRATKEVNNVVENGNFEDIYTSFINALTEFDVEKAADTMVIMYDTFSSSTYAVFGYFLNKVQDRFSEKIIEENNPDKINKAEEVFNITEELLDSDYKEES